MTRLDDSSLSRADDVDGQVSSVFGPAGQVKRTGPGTQEGRDGPQGVMDRDERAGAEQPGCLDGGGRVHHQRLAEKPDAVNGEDGHVDSVSCCGRPDRAEAAGLGAHEYIDAAGGHQVAVRAQPARALTRQAGNLQVARRPSALSPSQDFGRCESGPAG